MSDWLNPNAGYQIAMEFRLREIERRLKALEQEGPPIRLPDLQGGPDTDLSPGDQPGRPLVGS